MTHKLPELPWAKDALEPLISQETIEFHYGKHHQAYVTKLNGLVEGTELAGKSLETLILESDGGVFNNAAQVWNHSFYWNCLAPNAGGEASGDIGKLITSQWDSFESFKEEFSQKAASNFGSGWTWLVLKNDKLEIVNTDDAKNPLKEGKTPLLTIDVWEHAYYVDYRNARPNYIDSFWKLVNWDFVNRELSKAQEN